MTETTVKTEEELKMAIQNQIEIINIDNPDLIKKLKHMATLKKCSPYAFGLAIASIVAFATGPIGAPLGAVSFLGAAAATGMSTTALLAIGGLAAAIGLSSFFAINKGYSLEWGTEINPTTGELYCYLKATKEMEEK